MLKIYPYFTAVLPRPFIRHLSHNKFIKHPLFKRSMATTEDTKTLAVLNEDELKDGQMKEVSFGEDGKVLLSRLNGQINATSAFCTHYGAPLAKGVLESSGRVVCPWHGACFNVCNGDIEDAPAVDSIHSFQASVQDGKILVTASQSATKKENKSRPPKLASYSVAEQIGPGVVIVGGGPGSLQTIESLREHGYGGPITMISSEPHAPIDRTKLSKALTTDATKLEWRTPKVLSEKYGVSLRLDTTVTKIDTQSKLINMGDSTLSYNQLVLALGSVPRKLPIEGVDLDNIFTLRKIQDTKKIDAALKPGKNLVVIGSSFISMELVVAVAKRELASIHVIGMEKVPFESILGEVVGSALMKFHQSNGVKFHMGAQVKALKPADTSSSAVGYVELGDGTKVEADVVVLGVGVAPATELLKESGFDLEKDGGVKVDESLRVVGMKDVFAIGDIAVWPQAQSGSSTRIEHYNVASNHGRAVGATIGQGSELQVAFSKVPIFWSAQGQQLRYCGIGKGFDDVIIQGQPDEMKFVAYYAKEGKIIAVASMQKDPIVVKCAELLRLGAMPSADEIKSGKDPLTIDITKYA